MRKKRQILTKIDGLLKRLLKIGQEFCGSNTVAANYKRKAHANLKQLIMSSAFT